MPQKFKVTAPDWDNIEDELHHIPFNFLWTLTSKHEILAVIITCLKWIFNYDCWMRVTAHPLGDPNTSKQKNNGEHHFLLKLPSAARYKYDEFPEPHLNCCQLQTLGELLDYLD